MQRKTHLTDEEIFELMPPETPLERRILTDPEVTEGLRWGEPRYGHPEGMVGLHIPEVLRNIDAVTPALTLEDRAFLRIVALTHDTFKNKEHKGSPRDWTQHHGILAKKFMEKLSTDKKLLTLLELHDEAYYAWRLDVLEKNPRACQQRLDMLLENVGDFLQLYYVFFKCDTRTGDKTQAPVSWFEQRISGIQIVEIS
ncbi:MAG: hypothetical protein RL757_474 [Bacteroidota bacterium]|jgi:hypothetical protein